MNSLIRRRGIRHFRLPQSFLENLVHIAASGFDAVVFLTYSNTDQPWCPFFSVSDAQGFCLPSQVFAWGQETLKLTLYSWRASSHVLTRMESSHISSCVSCSLEDAMLEITWRVAIDLLLKSSSERSVVG